MPNFEIKCRACGYTQDLLLTSQERDRFDDILNMLPCEKCFKCDWVRLPTSANIPKSGRYSFEEK